MKSHSRFAPRWLPLETLEARVVLSADLVVDLVTAPTGAQLGTEIEVSWVVRNAGDASTASGEFGWTDGLYLSADDVLDANDLYLGEYFAERASPLAPGETYTTTAAVWLPADALLSAGQYRLLVAADIGEWEAEGDERNNGAASGALDISVPLLPDLTVGQVNTNATGQFGESIAISWTISNTGPGSTFIEWTDGIYLSTDDLLDGGDQWIELVEYTVPTAPLAPGESVTVQAIARLPHDTALAAGSYRLIVVADDYAMQAESDETNNASASAPIEITAAAPADLIVENVVALTSAPGSGELGEFVTLTWTIRNTGEGTAMWWGDEIYLSSDSILDASDLSLISVDGNWGNGLPLGPGESVEMQATIRLPNAGAAAAGTYRLLVQADAWDSVAETNETNNTGASAEITIGAPTAADLVVESGVAPANGELGQTIEISWVVRNQGTGSAPTWGWADGVYLSLDGELSGDDMQVAWSDAGWNGVLSLAGGQSQSGQTTLWLPQDGSVQPGVYQIIIAADVDGQVFDADRSNNSLLIATIEITGEITGQWSNSPSSNPELGGMMGGGLANSRADGLMSSAVVAPEAAIAATTGAGLSNLIATGAAGDQGSALFTFTDPIGAAQTKGLAKINLRVANGTATPVVRSNFVQ